MASKEQIISTAPTVTATLTDLQALTDVTWTPAGPAGKRSVTLTDLQALTDVTEGFMSEAGEYANGRYADPVEVEEAVANAKSTIQNVLHA